MNFRPLLFGAGLKPGVTAWVEPMALDRKDA